MKTVTLIFSMMAFFIFNSFAQNVNVKELLEKPETRTEIFDAILNDHELMMDFKKAMKGNEHAIMMMTGNNQMMSQEGKVEMNGGHQMMDHSDMMGMMKDNPEMMQKMKEKGMMGPDGKMKTMNSESQKENK
jgi:hypothetical protein